MTYTETTKRPRKARTPKKCAECLTEIAAGTIYIANSESYEGRYNPLHRHEDCIAAAIAVDAEITHDGDVAMFLHTAIRKNPSLVPSLPEILEEYPDVLKRLGLTNSGNHA